MGRIERYAWLICLGLACSGSPVFAASDAAPDDLMNLSLEELMQVEITTFSRRPTQLSRTPAAVFVVSANDIAHSGARSIPDVLRMVPGLQVAQLDASTWAVTARGSNGVYANKLLVLMDGRTLYTPFYSGVYWGLQDTDLSSIERIEVIRGPGATMWGANAVNGVINIITKKAGADPGSTVSVASGNLRSEGQVSHAGTVAGTDYRSYLKYFDRDAFADTGYDDWDMLRAGLRVDGTLGESDQWFLNTEIFTADIGESTLITSPTPPYNQLNNINRDVDGAFLLTGWSRTLSETSGLQFKMFFDHTDRDGGAPEEVRDTFDIDMQHYFRAGDRHNIIWGVNYRLSEDETTGDFVISLDPASRTQHLLSAFAQDEIRLVGDELFMTVGTKLEKNSFSNNSLEWEPNIRLSWNVSETQTLWGSVARAVRVPSRIEQSATINGAVLPPGAPGNSFPVPFVLTIVGDPDMDTEEVIAYELGYRQQFSESTHVDVAVFYNQYSNLRIIDARAPVCQPGSVPISVNPMCFLSAQYVSLPIQMENGGDIDTHGLELSASHRFSPAWTMQAAYTYLHSDALPNAVSSAVSQDYPDQQLSLRTAFSPTATTDMDFWVRYVDQLSAQNVDSYLTLDTRFSWRPVPALELALVGRNLLGSGHVEFLQEFNETESVEVEREAYLELRWHFQE
jgi:iron complex outermembrane receptor protein